MLNGSDQEENIYNYIKYENKFFCKSLTAILDKVKTEMFRNRKYIFFKYYLTQKKYLLKPMNYP